MSDQHPCGVDARSRRQVFLSMAAAFLASHPARAFAQRALTLVVPFAPGGIADITARPLAISLGKELGEPVVVQNRAGGGGSVGMAQVARLRGDSSALLMALSSIVVIPEADKILGRRPAYELSQFSPIALVTADPTVLVVKAESKWQRLEDLLRDAKAKPDEIRCSSSGLYGTTHLAQAMLWQSAKVDVRHIPYLGGGPSLTALLSGEVDVTVQAPGTVAQLLKAGRVRLLATWGAERLAAFPDLPTLREQGYDVEFYIWTALYAPAGLPENRLAKLRDAAQNAVNSREFAAAMSAANTPIRFMQGAKLERYLDQEQRRLAAVVEKIGKVE